VNPRVLFIEDEEKIALTVADRLKAEGYAVDVSEDGESGLREALSGAHDVLILDIMLPRVDGLSIRREIRAAGSKLPILMLSAKGDVVDRVVGLKFGADDYLSKPFEMAELLARVEALLRRTGENGGDTEREVHRFRGFELDTRRQELRRDGEVIPLSTQEYRLLEYFVRHPGEVHSRNELLDAVWGYDETPYTRTVDVHIAWLRRKLHDSPHPRSIGTVRGRGYKFVADLR
jgi:two-component system alkaline phosphatase synthesis response regulator PhoP